jgi:hypothetical protein
VRHPGPAPVRERMTLMSQMSESGDPRDAAAAPAPVDLPPVEPPSAGFIVQLFVIPALIVAVVIVVWLLFGRLAGGERDPMDYVRTIQSANENQRYRAAFELASLIHNDHRLASDPVLLGELSVLLDRELEKAEDPRLPQYLAATLGAFQTLEAETSEGRKVAPLAVLARALADKQPDTVRTAAAESLARQAARQEGTLDDPGVVRALAEAAAGEPPELRERAVFALGFFGGAAATEALKGRLGEGEENRFVRYNAAAALGRRGDPAAIDILREMLSTRDLQKVVRLDNAAETQNKIEAIELLAIQSLQTAAQQGHPELARELRPEVTALTASGLVKVRTEAAALLKLLPENP